MSGNEGRPPAPKSAAEQAAMAVGEDAPPPGMSEGAANAMAQAARDRVQSPPPHPPRRKGDLKSEEVLDKQANRSLRDTYAKKAYELAADCIHFWIFLILANGLITAMLGKQVISDTALIAITTGVTVNVLAAFLGVIRGLFPTDKANQPDGAENSNTDKK